MRITKLSVEDDHVEVVGHHKLDAYDLLTAAGYELCDYCERFVAPDLMDENFRCQYCAINHFGNLADELYERHRDDELLHPDDENPS